MKPSKTSSKASHINKKRGKPVKSSRVVKAVGRRSAHTHSKAAPKSSDAMAISPFTSMTRNNANPYDEYAAFKFDFEHVKTAPIMSREGDVATTSRATDTEERSRHKKQRNRYINQNRFMAGMVKRSKAINAVEMAERAAEEARRAAKARLTRVEDSTAELEDIHVDPLVSGVGLIEKGVFVYRDDVSVMHTIQHNNKTWFERRDPDDGFKMWVEVIDRPTPDATEPAATTSKKRRKKSRNW